MYPRLISLLLFCLFPFIVQAQYEKEQEEVAHGQIGAARDKQLKSFWSLSSADLILKIADKNETQGWHVNEVDANPRPITIPSGTKTAKITSNSPVSKKRSGKKSVRSTFTHSSSFYKSPYKAQHIRNAQQNAAKKEAQRKQQAANMAMQATQYNTNMSAYRTHSSQRIIADIERIDQVKAVDFANVPQGTAGPKPKTMNNRQLADLLKPENKTKGNITVILVEPNTNRNNLRNVSIGSKDKFIDLYGDGGYNQKESDLWEQAMCSDDPIVKLNTKNNTHQYESITLIEGSWLNLDSLNITTLPDMGCIALIGDSILLLDNDNLPFLKWSVQSNVSQVLACGDRTFGKQDYRVVEIKDSGLSIVCELENEDFNIYPETDSTFIICAPILDLSIVTRVNINRMTYDELLRISSDIRKIVSNGRVTLALQKNNIIDISQSPTLLYRSVSRLNDFCMCNEGLLVATDESVLLLVSPTEVLTFAGEGATKLWCDGTDIYLINKNGDLKRYSKKYE